MNQIKEIAHDPTAAIGEGLRNIFFRVLLCSALVWSMAGHADPPPGGTAPIITPAGGFAIDGNLFANTLEAGIGDWVYSTNYPGIGSGVLSIAGVPLQSATTFHIIDPYNSSSTDLIFAGGNKWTDNPNLWGWVTSKPSSKTDLNNALLHIGHDVDGNVWIAISADRFSTSGDSYIDFEFLQNTLTRNSNGAFTSAGPHGGRTTNDILLSLAFTGGGKVADFFAWRWQPNGAGGYSYADVTAAMPAGRVFAALNSNTVAIPYSAFGQMSYAANAFAEARSGFDHSAGQLRPMPFLRFQNHHDQNQVFGFQYRQHRRFYRPDPVFAQARAERRCGRRSSPMHGRRLDRVSAERDCHARLAGSGFDHLECPQRDRDNR